MALTITSPANPTVKMLKGLQSKKGRAETGLFLAEGARLVGEAADLGVTPAYLAIADAAFARPAIASLARRLEAAGAKVMITSEAILEAISKRDNTQTVIAAFRQPENPIAALDGANGKLFVALDGVRDPGNLGTIWRTCDAVGADGLILIGQTCDPYALEAVRATMGSLFAVPMARCDFAAFDAWRAAGGLSVYGASLKGAHLAESAPVSRCVALMGNEQSGLAAEIEAQCDRLVKLPMAGRADSLNLAAATSALVYDLWRRRGYEGARDG
jgi:RNA methyltransferase, TrmH family